MAVSNELHESSFITNSFVLDYNAKELRICLQCSIRCVVSMVEADSCEWKDDVRQQDDLVFLCQPQEHVGTTVLSLEYGET